MRELSFSRAMLSVAFLALAGCTGDGGGAATKEPLLAADTELDLIRVSEAVWAREAAVGVKALSPAERVFLCVWELEAEVNNGGFEQFYINSAGDNALETPMALREIGATQAAAIVEEANNVFRPSGPPPDRDARVQALEELGMSQPMHSTHWTPGSTTTLTTSRNFCGDSSSAIANTSMSHSSWLPNKWGRSALPNLKQRGASQT